jgi:hypothetical protein
MTVVRYCEIRFTTARECFITAIRVTDEFSSVQCPWGILCGYLYQRQYRDYCTLGALATYHLPIPSLTVQRIYIYDLPY